MMHYCSSCFQDDGNYSYVGKGSDTEEDIGQLRTIYPLKPYPGLLSFEITIVDPGELARA